MMARGSGVQQVELLTFHKLAESKYTGLGREYLALNPPIKNKCEMEPLVILFALLDIPVIPETSRL